MGSIIMIRVNGLMDHEVQRQYRKELLNDIKEGLFIIDDKVEDVVVSNINDLGLE